MSEIKIPCQECGNLCDIEDMYQCDRCGADLCEDCVDWSKSGVPICQGCITEGDMFE